MFESHLRQLIFFTESDCLGCAVLLCLVVCLTLLASSFLPSHLSLKHVLSINITQQTTYTVIAIYSAVVAKSKDVARIEEILANYVFL